MTQRAYMRVWQSVDVESIQKHLLIMGDLTGDCAGCRELGIKYDSVRECPKCGTEFKFITVRQGTSSARMLGATVKRIKERRPDLSVIDYADYQSLSGKKAARDFFG